MNLLNNVGSKILHEVGEIPGAGQTNRFHR